MMCKSTYQHIQFGTQLRRWRTAVHVSPRELAEKSAVTTGFISHLETGRTLPGKRTCRALAQALGIPELEMLAAAGYVSDYHHSDDEYLEPPERLFFRDTWGKLSKDERSLLRDTMRMFRNRVKTRNNGFPDADAATAAGAEDPT